MPQTIVKNIFNRLDDFHFRWKNTNFLWQLRVIILCNKFFILFWTVVRQELQKAMRNYFVITEMFWPRNVNWNFLICISNYIALMQEVTEDDQALIQEHKIVRKLRVTRSEALKFWKILEWFTIIRWEKNKYFYHNIYLVPLL